MKDFIQTDFVPANNFAAPVLPPKLRNRVLACEVNGKDVLAPYKFRQGECVSRTCEILFEGYAYADSKGFKDKFFWDRVSEKDKTIFAGGFMETDVALIKAAEIELKEAKKSLEDLYNKTKSVQDAVIPELAKLIKEIRSVRMTVTSEISSMLKDMTDIRKFFLDSSYKEEMERLKNFVNICQEIKKLKQDGTFDAICESAIKMAIKEGGE